ncbi:hypothetical protein CHELA40_50846 [Chelatococcus asaccharovorans]|nr:hypothetical protein CHELA17_20811 [Chelatococcus asaccharovorans]CAH1694521.1 hypothetical protein CHELA40_50846 [Chelatococcus asaccharovorans]
MVKPLHAATSPALIGAGGVSARPSVGDLLPSDMSDFNGRGCARFGCGAARPRMMHKESRGE